MDQLMPYISSSTLLKVIVGGVGMFAASNVFIDTFYFMRMTYHTLWNALFHKRKPLLEEYCVTVVVTTQDLDYMVHMNNARYNRECDFGRFGLLTQVGFYRITKLMRKQTKSHGWGLAATTIRYRRSLHFLDICWLKSKIVYWDADSLYIEQSFVNKRDGFIHATLYAKMKMTAMPMETIVEKLGYHGPVPEPTADLLSWISYNKESSQRLRPQLDTSVAT